MTTLLTKLGERHEQCVKGLKQLGGKATANALARHLLAIGVIPFYNTNYTNPRLIELRQEGIVKVIGSEIDPLTNRKCSIYSLTEMVS